MRLNRISIRDLLGVTAIIAVHFAAIPLSVRPSAPDWPVLLALTPTVITCLIHRRLQLTIAHASILNYLLTLAWVFLHECCCNLALNAYNRAHPSPNRDYQVAPLANAWNDVLDVAILAVALPAAYAMICYTAKSVPSESDGPTVQAGNSAVDL